MYLRGGIRELELNIQMYEEIHNTQKIFSKREWLLLSSLLPSFYLSPLYFCFSFSFSLGSNSERPQPRVELYRDKSMKGKASMMDKV